MKFPFLASFIVFGITLTYGMRKASRRKEHEDAFYWEREREANTTLRKPLDDLVFLTVPMETLPFGACPGDEVIEDCERLVRTYEHKKAVNLTGLTNTDLKLLYGAPNLQILTIYDNNYTQLVRTLHKWAEALCQKECPQQARIILEYAISTGSDISKSYSLLAGIYSEAGNLDAIRALREQALTLRSLTKDMIVRHLDSLLRENR